MLRFKTLEIWAEIPINGITFWLHFSRIHLSFSIIPQMAKILSTSLFRSPQISYGSSNPDLGNKVRFPYFLRTVPTDTNLAMAIVKVLQ